MNLIHLKTLLRKQLQINIIYLLKLMLRMIIDPYNLI